MFDFCTRTLHELEDELKLISFDFDNPIMMCDMSLKAIVKNLAILKKYVLENGFADKEQEIYFFKYLKPKFTSKLIYFKKVRKIETRKPVGGAGKQIKYLKNELDKLNLHFVENQYFYNYIRSGDDFLDDKIFVRDNLEIDYNLEVFYYELDPQFSTTHDFKVAYILANDFFQKYIESKIKSLQENTPSFITTPIANKRLKWTGTKSDLIEVIYAFHSEKVINNGQADIKEIAKIFERMFDVDLGDVYRGFAEIKKRKNGKSKFIVSMVNSLDRRADD